MLNNIKWNKTSKMYNKNVDNEYKIELVGLGHVPGWL